MQTVWFGHCGFSILHGFIIAWCDTVTLSSWPWGISPCCHFLVLGLIILSSWHIQQEKAYDSALSDHKFCSTAHRHRMVKHTCTRYETEHAVPPPRRLFITRDTHCHATGDLICARRCTHLFDSAIKALLIFLVHFATQGHAWLKQCMIHRLEKSKCPPYDWVEATPVGTKSANSGPSLRRNAVSKFGAHATMHAHWSALTRTHRLACCVSLILRTVSEATQHKTHASRKEL